LNGNIPSPQGFAHPEKPETFRERKSFPGFAVDLSCVPAVFSGERSMAAKCVRRANDRMGNAGGRTNRRRLIDPTTCERDYSADEMEFMQALEAYKLRTGRLFPTCSEVLEVVRGLGYVRAASA
jgi:hypothetical protein